MANVTYLGDEPTTWGGVAFAPNEPVDVQEEWLLAKARGNSFFSVEEGAAEPEEDGAEEDETIGEFTVQRRGRAGWCVVRGAEVLEKGLTREAAEDRARELSEQA